MKIKHWLSIFILFIAPSTFAQNAVWSTKGYGPFKGNYTPASLRISPDGKTIAAISYSENMIKFFDSESGKQIDSFTHPEVVTIKYSNDGKWLLSGGLSQIKVWDIATRSIFRTFTTKTIFASLDLSPDNRYLVSDGPGVIYIWDVVSGDQTKEIKTRETELTFSPDGLKLAGVTKDIQLWNVEDWSTSRQFGGHVADIYCLTFSSKGEFIATSSQDETVKVWDLEDGKLLQTLTGHKDWVTVATFTPDDKYVVSASYDNSIKIWRVSDGKLMNSFTAHKKGITDLSISPDGKFIISAGRDGIIRKWNFPVITE